MISGHIFDFMYNYNHPNKYKINFSSEFSIKIKSYFLYNTHFLKNTILYRYKWKLAYQQRNTERRFACKLLFNSIAWPLMFRKNDIKVLLFNDKG